MWHFKRIKILCGKYFVNYFYGAVIVLSTVNVVAHIMKMSKCHYRKSI